MMLNRRHLLGALGGGLASLAARPVWAIPAVSERPALLPRALAALDAHRARIAEPGLIALVDFARHSSDARLDLVDVANGKVLESHLVAHGRGSDPGNSGWVQHFSNRVGSNASSPGAYLTGELYHGRHGRARRLDGLEPANDLARERGIVIHAAGYVDPALVARQGHIGRSEGCFALAPGVLGRVLERLGPGHLLFAAK